jgi:hypothetical protein
MKLRYILTALIALSVVAPTFASAETTIIKKGDHHDRMDSGHHGKTIIVKKHGHEHHDND